jgi:hypothetical protein
LFETLAEARLEHSAAIAFSALTGVPAKIIDRLDEFVVVRAVEKTMRSSFSSMASSGSTTIFTFVVVIPASLVRTSSGTRRSSATD